MWHFSKKIILKYALLYTVKKEFFYWSITSKGYSHVTDILCPGGGGWWGQYLGHWLSLYNNQTCAVSSSKGYWHVTDISCPRGGARSISIVSLYKTCKICKRDRGHLCFTNTSSLFFLYVFFQGSLLCVCTLDIYRDLKKYIFFNKLFWICFQQLVIANARITHNV